MDPRPSCLTRQKNLSSVAGRSRVSVLTISSGDCCQLGLTVSANGGLGKSGGSIQPGQLVTEICIYYHRRLRLHAGETIPDPSAGGVELASWKTKGRRILLDTWAAVESLEASAHRLRGLRGTAGYHTSTVYTPAQHLPAAKTGRSEYRLRVPPTTRHHPLPLASSPAIAVYKW